MQLSPGQRARLRFDELRKTKGPQALDLWAPSGAGERSRTLDLLITNELLYQLSYTGETFLLPSSRPYYCVTSVAPFGLRATIRWASGLLTLYLRMSCSTN